MFRFKAQNKSDTIEEIKSFTINLLRKTRPNLSENLRRIVAEDLISRAGVEVGYTTEESEEDQGTFKCSTANNSRQDIFKRNFSMPARIKSGRNIKSSSTSLDDKENKQSNNQRSYNEPDKSCVSKLSKSEQISSKPVKAVAPQMIEALPNRKRTYKYSTPSLPSSNIFVASTPANKSQVKVNGPSRKSREIRRASGVAEKIIQADVLQGAPEMKKKRISSDASQSDKCSDSPHIENVFERLYSMRKHKCCHKASTEDTTKKNLTRNKSTLGLGRKVNTSVDSIQKQLSDFTI